MNYKIQFCVLCIFLASCFTDPERNNPSDPKSSSFIPNTVTGVTASDGEYSDGVLISWDYISGAVSYSVFRYVDGEQEDVGSTTDNSLMDESCTNLITYEYYVVPVFEDGNGGEFGEPDTGYRYDLSPPQTVTTTLGKDANCVDVSFERIDGAGTYALYRSESEDGEFVQVALSECPDGVISDATLTDTQNGTIFYYKVAAYDCDHDRIGDLSESVEGLALARIALSCNDIQMELHHIPGGTFVMGDDQVAKPMHAVTVSDFYIGQTEVTYAFWKSVLAFATTNGYTDYTFDDDDDSFINGLCGTLDSGDTTQPVVCLTWYDAIKFCNLLTEIELGEDECVYVVTSSGDPLKSNTGNVNITVNRDRDGYRLPTEAEWEYACRSWTTSSYYWGDEYTKSAITPYAWFAYNSYGQTKPVSGKLPNDFYLFDMNGNVWEWCTEDYVEYTTSSTIVVDPPESIDEDDDRVIRGGSNVSSPVSLLSATRSSMAVNKMSSDLGFRIAKNVSEEE